MATVAEVFSLAWQHHQAGAFSQAEQLYRQILAFNPGHVDSWCFLGAVCQAQGKLADAEVGYRRATQLAPGYADAHNCLGALLAQQDRLPEAVDSFLQALRAEPNNAQAHYNLGLAFNAQGNTEKAISRFQEALRLQPQYPEALNDLGNALAAQQKLSEAVNSYQHALRLRPDYAEAHYNLGVVLGRQDKLDDEIAQYRRALQLKPNYAEAYESLGNAFREQGKMDEALRCFDQALHYKPQNSLAHWNRSVVLLLRGDFEGGWPEYEWRWAQHRFAKRDFAQPLWDGSDLHGKTVLLYAEQGLGDTLHFIRYAPLVKQRGGSVIVECQPPLSRLLAGFCGIDCLLPHGSPLPAFDVQAPLLSLPGILHTTLANVPANVPYLHAGAGLAKHWRRHLRSDESGKIKDEEKKDHGSSFILHPSSFRVGIAWQGDPANPAQRQRSIPLARFAPLSEVRGVRLFSLQKGYTPSRAAGFIPAEQTAERTGGINPAACDLTPEVLPGLDEAAGPFMDTAAVMMNLDLVITSDTSIAHLAGALGVPVWLALPGIPDWRWLLEREDSPWYPTMRLFRQTQRGKWEDAFERMAYELTLAIHARG